MSPADAARVLAKAQAYDRRTVGQADVQAWYEALCDLDLNAVLAAVADHYRDSTDWLMPAHVRRLTRQAPSDRPLRAAIAEQSVAFDAVANRRGIEAARTALAERPHAAAGGA